MGIPYVYEVQVDAPREGMPLNPMPRAVAVVATSLDEAVMTARDFGLVGPVTRVERLHQVVLPAEWECALARGKEEAPSRPQGNAVTEEGGGYHEEVDRLAADLAGAEKPAAHAVMIPAEAVLGLARDLLSYPSDRVSTNHVADNVLGLVERHGYDHPEFERLVEVSDSSYDPEEAIMILDGMIGDEGPTDFQRLVEESYPGGAPGEETPQEASVKAKRVLGIVREMIGHGFPIMASAHALLVAVEDGGYSHACLAALLDEVLARRKDEALRILDVMLAPGNADDPTSEEDAK